MSLSDKEKAQVYDIIKAHPEGIRAKRIAKKMHVEKGDVNRYLHYEGDGLFVQNEDWTWSPIPEEPPSDDDLEYNDTIKQRIIGKDSFDEVPHVTGNLYNHQKAGKQLANRYNVLY